jgi:hypothetical protein
MIPDIQAQPQPSEFLSKSESHAAQERIRLSSSIIISKNQKSGSLGPILILDGRQSLKDSPRAFGGILDEVNSLNSLPIKPTLRNAELFRFCEL